ncbi:DNA-binding protein [Pseudoxanthomonas gei]|uniref:DNA-binding protein n=1 Tax=Pseudoxanthomonas gei TaxID=1383030 RepID=A0ABX0ABF8_9GAMM|nr:winged helix-turn-helix domain-containing protein [Pseudoxanthomonas gei]NDK37885.1 DNA-binding protein [Pseudoxanthomonas gei]
MHSLRLGDVTVDPAAGTMVGPAGREQLDPKVMQVLVVLARRAGEVVPRHELLEEVWPGVVVGDDVVSRCIYQLRRHLRQAGGERRHAALVETLPKRGYRLNGAPAVGPPPAISSAHATPAARARPRWPLAVGLVAGVMAVAAGLAWRSTGRTDADWPNPLAGARFTRVTDFEGVAPSVAISRDGSRIAFLASGDGPLDAWITGAGTGEFRNLTRGRVPGIDNPVRSLAFTPYGSQLAVWTRNVDAAGAETIDTWAVPSTGGLPHRYLDNVAEVDWSPDGRRRVSHPAAPGDPLSVADAGQPAGRQIYIAPNGIHCHYPLWSPDGAFIYFVQGRPPDDMDVWRIPSAGGQAERITRHGSRVSHPVFLDSRTLAYLATAADGSGPWLHGMDLERRIAHRLGPELAEYTSLAASANGRRLVATQATPRTSLWRVPVMARVASETDARRIGLPVAGGRSPRAGPGYLLVVSPSDGRGIGRLATADNRMTELWNGGPERLVAGPAIDPVRQRIAFTTTARGSTRLQVMDADGSGLRALAAHLQVTGAPAWSPDGKAILVAVTQGLDTRLFKVPVDGAPATPFAADYSRDATFSPDGSFLVFNGADVGPTFPVKALGADGQPRDVPDLVLPRGTRHLVFLPGSNALVVLRGPAHKRDFWRVDLDTGRERQLTDFGSAFAIGEFDVSADGREIIFDQLREESDVVQIDLRRR